jgi:exopolysaccharide biosynthesis protein
MTVAHPTALEPITIRTATAAKVKVRVVEIRLDDPRVRIGVQVAKRFPGGDEEFGSMVSRSKPELAINGAYFSKESLLPIGDIVMDGKVAYQGMMGTALAITEKNEAVIRRVTMSRHEDWRPYRTVMACGPLLVMNGRVDVMPSVEGFRDPHIMATTRRMGVGIKDKTKLLIVTTLQGVSFQQWANVMQALGCSDAMNLDAGASLAMYYKGKTLIRPSRRLTNLLTVHLDPSKLLPNLEDPLIKPAEGAKPGGTAN